MFNQTHYNAKNENTNNPIITNSFSNVNFRKTYGFVYNNNKKNDEIEVEQNAYNFEKKPDNSPYDSKLKNNIIGILGNGNKKRKYSIENSETKHKNFISNTDSKFNRTEENINTKNIEKEDNNYGLYSGNKNVKDHFLANTYQKDFNERLNLSNIQREKSEISFRSGFNKNRQGSSPRILQNPDNANKTLDTLDNLSKINLTSCDTVIFSEKKNQSVDNLKYLDNQDSKLNSNFFKLKRAYDYNSTKNTMIDNNVTNEDFGFKKPLEKTEFFTKTKDRAEIDFETAKANEKKLQESYISNKINKEDHNIQPKKDIIHDINPLVDHTQPDYNHYKSDQTMLEAIKQFKYLEATSEVSP